MRTLVVVALVLALAYAAPKANVCYQDTPKNSPAVAASTSGNAQASWYGNNVCCNSNYSTEAMMFNQPLGKCAWGFRGNFSASEAKYDWNVTTIYMANFSTGCKEQLDLFFAGIYCSPNWDTYISYNESNLLTEQADITSVHACAMRVNRLFVACSLEYVPAGLVSGGNYNPNYGVMPCANFTEVFPTAISLLAWFSQSTLATPFTSKPYFISQNFTNPDTNETYYWPNELSTFSEITFNPFPYPLKYDLASTQTCYNGANSMVASPILLVLLIALILIAML